MMTKQKYNYLNRLFPNKRISAQRLEFRAPIGIFGKSIWVKPNDLVKINISEQKAANIKAASSVVGFLLGTVIALNLTASASLVLLLALPVVFGLLSFLVFDLYVIDRVKYIEFQIATEVPGFMDMLSAQIETNPGARAIESIELVSKSYNSLLTSKIDQVLKLIPVTNSQKMLQILDSEFNNPEMHDLVSTIAISERYGINPAKAVKDLAERSHENRLLKSKDLGQKSAAALLIPLVIFFLPVTFVIFLIPAILGFLKG